MIDSLGERYGLRIIPGRNSFLVLPNNVSRSTAVGAILHPGGPARSPVQRSRSGDSWMLPTSSSDGLGTSGLSSSYPSTSFMGLGLDDGGYSGYGGYAGGGGDGAGGGLDIDFMLAVSSDEKLLRRLNEFDGAETVSTSGKGTDAKWRLNNEEAVGVLKGLAGV